MNQSLSLTIKKLKELNKIKKHDWLSLGSDLYASKATVVKQWKLVFNRGQSAMQLILNIVCFRKSGMIFHQSENAHSKCMLQFNNSNLLFIHSVVLRKIILFLRRAVDIISQ